jgi:REP element-mobilizing transposase RayT
MARPLRIHLTGGFYHVTLRGNHQELIFRTVSDRALLNSIVARALLRYQAKLHAFCWMSNHLHFLVEVGELPLGMVVRDIASNYARAFQRKLPTTGHLFERRYHATLVDVDSYFLELLRYIHFNPVEAGIVDDVSRYPWSSHHAYAGGFAEPWLTTEFGLAMFSPIRQRAHAAYCEFVNAPLQNRRLDETKLGIEPILGEERFLARISAPCASRLSEESLSELISEGCARFALDEAQLMSEVRSEATVQARGWIAQQAILRGIGTLSAVARALGRDRATLRYAMRRYQKLV